MNPGAESGEDPGVKTYELQTEVRIPGTLDRVFAFFADAGNLELLTPPWLSFRILTPRPIAMSVGVLIDYRISMRGIPMRWRSEITAWSHPSGLSTSNAADRTVSGSTSTRSGRMVPWLQCATTCDTRCREGQGSSGWSTWPWCVPTCTVSSGIAWTR